MKVRIKSAEEGDWYRNFVGKEFDAVNYSAELFFVNGNRAVGKVKKSDCEILIEKE